MLSPDIKKIQSLAKTEKVKDENYIKTTTSQDGDMKKIFMAAGETLLTALVGPKVAARYLRGLTLENIQKEKVARIVRQIITPEVLRQRLKNQAKLHSHEKDASREELSKEERDALRASRMQDMENGKDKDEEEG